MNTLMKWGKRLVLMAILAPYLLMAFEVWRVPSYHMGKAYVSFSPDGKYKISTIFADNTHTTIFELKSLPDNKVLAIALMPHWWIGSVKDVWFCGDYDTDCTSYTYDLGERVPRIPLPPTVWQQVHAWLTIKIKGLENPQLVEIIED